MTSRPIYRTPSFFRTRRYQEYQVYRCMYCYRTYDLDFNFPRDEEFDEEYCPECGSHYLSRITVEEE